MVGEVEVSAVRTVPGCLRGRIVGRGVPGLFYSSDLVLHDGTGYMLLEYSQLSGLWELVFGALWAERLIGRTGTAYGWYRRDPMPRLELRELRLDDGHEVASYSYPVGQAFVEPILANPANETPGRVQARPSGIRGAFAGAECPSRHRYGYQAAAGGYGGGSRKRLRMAIEVRYDRQVQAIYVVLSDQPYDHGRDLDENRRIDYAEDGTPIGVELLDVDQGVHLQDLPQADAIADALAPLEVRILV